MSPVTFGLRTAEPTEAARPGGTCPAAVQAEPLIDADTIIAALPILTAGLTLLLVAIFTLEVKLDFGASTTIDGDTLVAFGGTSWAAVAGHGEIWRLPLAPLLHVRQEHLLGNAFSLLSIGLLLEPLVGHGWFAAIFCLGSLGATAASLLGNPDTSVAVGASGGIMALVAAAFLLSWHPRASEDATKMFRRSLLFGVPALLPMVLHLPRTGGVQVDYQAHLGGAVVGALMALGMRAIWPDGDRRPQGGARAGAFALAWIVAVAVSACFAAGNRARMATLATAQGTQLPALAARFIPPGKLPSTLTDGIPMAETFVRLYPQDPRGHLLQAFAWQRMRDFTDAERELRLANELIDKDDAHRFETMRPVVTVSWALAQLRLGQPLEARATARLPCQMETEVKQPLVAAGLCR